MDIGLEIKKYRNKRGFTQVKLADKANISRSYLADVERNRYNASLETLTSIASALDIPLAALLEESDEPYDTHERLTQELKEYKEQIEKTQKINSALNIVPEKFIDADEARSYISKHTILSADGFDLNQMTDEDVLEFANAILEQIKMVGYKYKK